MRKKAVKFKDLAHHAHFDLLEELEKRSLKGFDFVMLLARRAILAELRKVSQPASLKKTIKPGWTGEVPRVDLNFDKMFERVLDKYFEALKWILMGDAAGKAAHDAAHAIGLDEEVIPGIVPSAYLNALDTHREHFETVFDKEAPKVKKVILTESLDQMKKRVERFANTSLDKLKNGMVTAAEEVAQQQYDANVAAVHQRAHELTESGMSKDKAVADAIENMTSDELAMPQVSRALREAVESYRKDWAAMTNAQTSTASAVGTHQAMAEVYGGGDRKVRVAWIAFRDEKTCSFCKEASRRSDGSFKIYGIGDFEPAGYNLSRKKAFWKLCVPPGHYNCRCSLVYIPEGFDIDDNGTLVPSKD